MLEILQSLDVRCLAEFPKTLKSLHTGSLVKLSSMLLKLGLLLKVKAAFLTREILFARMDVIEVFFLTFVLCKGLATNLTMVLLDSHVSALNVS